MTLRWPVWLGALGVVGLGVVIFVAQSNRTAGPHDQAQAQVGEPGAETPGSNAADGNNDHDSLKTFPPSHGSVQIRMPCDSITTEACETSVTFIS